MNEETVELVNAEHTAFAAPIAFVVLLLIGQVWHEHQGLLTVAALVAFVFSLGTLGGCARAARAPSLVSVNQNE